MEDTQATGRLPFYCQEEVATHNVASDCWVSFFGYVYDLTPLIQEHKGALVQPILKYAGQDISHFFDPQTKDPKTWIHPELNIRVPYTPDGRYVHIPPPEPVSTWSTDIAVPWWRDERYRVGQLSTQRRLIRIVNLLTAQSDILQVCAEETLNEIRQRYVRYNSHIMGYTWKRLGRPLNMDRTLSENGIIDEGANIPGADPEDLIPSLHIHFNDDLTVA